MRGGHGDVVGGQRQLDAGLVGHHVEARGAPDGDGVLGQDGLGRHDRRSRAPGEQAGQRQQQGERGAASQGIEGTSSASGSKAERFPAMHRAMSFGRNPHVTKAEAAEQKADVADDERMREASLARGRAPLGLRRLLRDRRQEARAVRRAGRARAHQGRLAARRRIDRPRSRDLAARSAHLELGRAGAGAGPGVSRRRCRSRSARLRCRPRRPHRRRSRPRPVRRPPQRPSRPRPSRRRPAW